MSKLMMMVLVAIVLAGCNTMNGVGKDMEKAGEAVQKKSSE
ncbi:MAG: entericidin A/B family lipoprotein [Methylophilus sp.]|jgi:predicted small secreted protein|nr:entericidin A/B family lipoprotein [Methylophilus sp.]HSH87990.1 entericidin A/B family lipoprotein [Methylophilus sp.]HSI29374.1 entericidin A/B family lipoprotein [Methylophilus sp.]